MLVGMYVGFYVPDTVHLVRLVPLEEKACLDRYEGEFLTVDRQRVEMVQGW